MYTYPHLPKKDGIVKLQKLSNDERAKLILIYGHFTFGIHEYLPQETTYKLLYMILSIELFLTLFCKKAQY